MKERLFQSLQNGYGKIDYTGGACMGNISWLHLSDLHLGRDVYNEEVILKELLIDIKKQTELNKIKLDFVFITGDITFSGQEKEFAYVQGFLNNLQNVINVDKENIILIPGYE